MTTTQGLTSTELKTLSEYLIKANNTQIKLIEDATIGEQHKRQTNTENQQPHTKV